MIACGRGTNDAQLTIVRDILRAEKSPKLDEQNADGETALQLASACGHLETVRELFAQGRQPLVDLQDARGRSACMRAAAGGHVLVVRQLLDLSSPSLVLRDRQGLTAVMHGRAWPEMCLFFSQLPGARLVTAARTGDLAVCKSLLADRVPVNYQTEDGTTSLMAASEYGHEAAVQVLLACRPPPLVLLHNAQPRSALMLASAFDRVRIAQLLLKHLNEHPGERSVLPRVELDPDHEERCMKSVCGKTFTLFTRRHVCGSCRLIVCAECAPTKMRIPRLHAGLPSAAAVAMVARNEASAAGVGAAAGVADDERVRVCTLCAQCLISV